MSDYGALKRHAWALLVEAVMAIGAVVMVVWQDWFHVATCLFTVTVSFLPLWFERTFRIYLPSWLQFTYVFFVFVSMFCGEVLHFYARVPGWDELMHSVSGLLVGFGFAMWLRWLQRHSKNIRLAGWLQAFIIICANCFIAVLWETIEFMSDQLFGTSSQDHSLFDTMTDLIYGTLGGVLLALLYARVLKGKRIAILSQAIADFEKHNT